MIMLQFMTQFKGANGRQDRGREQDYQQVQRYTYLYKGCVPKEIFG